MESDVTGQGDENYRRSYLRITFSEGVSASM